LIQSPSINSQRRRIQYAACLRQQSNDMVGLSQSTGAVHCLCHQLDAPRLLGRGGRLVLWRRVFATMGTFFCLRRKGQTAACAVNHEACRATTWRLRGCLFHAAQHKFLSANAKATPIANPNPSGDRAPIDTNSVPGAGVFDVRLVACNGDASVISGYERIVDCETAACAAPDQQLPLGEIHFVQ
jgi:hypothetical protein